MVIPIATRALRVSEHVLPHPHRPPVSPTASEQNQRQRPSTPPDRAVVRPSGHAPAAPRLLVRRWGGGALALALSDSGTHCTFRSAQHLCSRCRKHPGPGERRAHRWRERARVGAPCLLTPLPCSLTLCPGAALRALLQFTLAPRSGHGTSFQASCPSSAPPSPGTLWPQKCPPPGTLASFSPPNSPKRTLLPFHP